MKEREMISRQKYSMFNTLALGTLFCSEPCAGTAQPLGCLLVMKRMMSSRKGAPLDHIQE